jgi:hypothetical protein
MICLVMIMFDDQSLESTMHFSRTFQHFLINMDNSAGREDLSRPEARCMLILAFHGRSTLVGLN